MKDFIKELYRNLSWGINCINTKKKLSMIQSSLSALGLPNISTFTEISLTLVVMEFKELIYPILCCGDFWRFLIFHEWRISASIAENHSCTYLYSLSTPGPTITWE